MTEPEGPMRPSGARLPSRVTLTLAVGVLGLALLAVAMLATRGLVSGEGSAQATGAQDVPAAQAATTPEPPLPEGMPTAKPAKLGAPLDPLSAEEVGYARALAAKDVEGAGKRVDGTPGLQFLSINLAELDDAEPRRAATIDSYDYATDEVVTQVVDLKAGKVTTERASGVQPPPSKREGDIAMLLLLESPLSKALKEDYESYTRRTLVAPEQLEFAAGSWTHERNGDGTGGEKCGEHRCVFFQISTGDGRGLVLTDVIVDLSAKKVLKVTKP